MNEEEKEAVEELKKQLRLAMNIDDIATTIRNGYAQTLLNLIEKLQKENEEKTTILLAGAEKVKQLEKENETLKNFVSGVVNGNIEKDFIPVQKVKDKIEKLNDESHAEELEDIMNRKNYTITELVQYVLQELLEGRK